MKQLETSRKFDKDLRKFGLLAPLVEVLSHLLNDTKMPEKYRDHALTENMKGFREYHIKPDLLLVYEKYDDKIVLIRLNTHSELFS